MMRELNVNETAQVDGGVLPLVIGVALADIGLIAAMKGAGYW